MKTIVLYKSKHDGTKQYANWIAEEISSDLDTIENFKMSNLKDYDTIVIGSSTYMGNIQAKKWLEKNWTELSQKKVVLFIVGIRAIDSKERRDSWEMIDSDIRDNVVRFELLGRIDMSKLNVAEKFIAKLMKEPEVNYIVKENIQPILDELNQIKDNTPSSGQ